MNSLHHYIIESKGKSTKLQDKISFVKGKIKEIDKLLKNGNATPTAAASRLSYVDMLEGLKKVEKYLLNNQLMNTTRSTSEFDKLSKQNNKILKEISKHFAGENAWTVIKDYQEEYED